MTNIRVSQSSFSRGELCPPLHLRSDLKWYSLGLKTLKNGFVHQEGCVSNRSGLEYVGSTKNAYKKSRLIPFIFNSEQTYIIEAGEYYFRFIHNGGYIQHPNPQAWQANKAYVVGDVVIYHEAHKYYCVQNHTSASHFSGDYYAGYWIAQDVYEIPTPYQADDLHELKFIQSADVLTLTHPNYAPRELARYGHTDWRLSEITVEPSIEPPTDISVVWTGAVNSHTRDYTYLVTAVDATTNEESKRSITVTAKGHREAYWEASEYFTITWLPVQNAQEYNIYKEVNGIFGYIGTSSEISECYPIYSGKYTNPTTTVNLQGDTIYTITLSDDNQTVIYTNAALAVDDLFYSDLELTNYYGKCTTITTASNNRTITLVVTGGQFVDDKIEPDMSDSAPIFKNPFENNNNPSCACYFQQRKIYANTYNEPQTLFASQVSAPDNFNTSRPLVSADAVTMVLADSKMNEIRHLVPFDDLIVLTTNSEYKVNGTDGKFEANPMPVASLQSTYGASHVQPVIYGDMLIFVEASGTVIRELGYDYLSDSYDGDELSLFASHLFEGKEVVAIDYARAPYRILYVVFNDGSLATLTYNRKQELCGWGRTETQGEFESVAVVREGLEDVAYFVVKRTINGLTKRYVERTKTRVVDNAKTGFFVDCGLYSHFDTPVTSVSGLEHLANCDVMVLADGGVIEGLKVSNNGTLTLPNKTTDIVVGLPYEFELETLGIEGENTHGLKKQINTVCVNVLNSREDFFVIGNQGSEQQFARSMNSINDTGYLYSGKKDATVLNTPVEYATVHLKQKYPLPLTITAISAIVNIEDVSDSGQ